MKLIEYKPEINMNFCPTPIKMTPTQIMELLYSERLQWKDLEGLDRINAKLWKAAKPKINHDYKAPLIIGKIGGEPVKIPHPLSNETLSREMQDIQDAHEFYVQKSYDILGINEIRWLSNSFEQEHEWIERKKKCPLLTVQDLQWVDNMVEKIYEKHTRKHFKENYYYHIESYTKTGFNKFFGPLS